MADIRQTPISQLPVLVESVSPSSPVVVVQGGTTYRTTVADLIAAAGAGYSDEQVRDVIGAALVAGSGVTITVDDGGDTITIAASGSTYTDEQAQDAAAAMLAAGTHTGITFTYDDAGNKVSAAVASPTHQSITSASSVTPAATDDVVTVSALAANLTINARAGTPTGRDALVFKVKDNGTSRTLTWDAEYVWMVTAVTATTAGKWHYFTAIYNDTDSKWHITGSVVQP